MKIIVGVFFFLVSHFSYAQVFDVDTLLWSGPAENRVNLVILGDGYQSNEQSQFVTDANGFMDKFFDETPYKEYKNYFNVVIIKVPSNESGASHPGTASDVTEPAHPISSVDNYFGSTFDQYDIHRLLVPTDFIAITSVLANNFPSYDQALILVNSPHYGGSGGQHATSSLNISASEIAIHEIGHSFVFLRDEYYAGDFYAFEGDNMTQETNPENVKWSNWMGDNDIDIYQHCCGGNSASWYRPHQNCKMKALNNPFCSVCTESTIERIHSLVSPIDFYSPQNGDLINLTTPIDFEVILIDPIPNTLKVDWFLNGNSLASDTDIVSIDNSMLMTGDNQLQVSVQDTSTMLRVDSHESVHFYSVLWDINSTITSIADVSKIAVNISLYPNPTKDILYAQLVEGINESYNISISDLMGNKLIAKEISDNSKPSEMDISGLAAGTYVISFKFNNNLVLTRKIVKF